MKVVDMHCDTISRLLRDRREGGTATLAENSLHLDLNKMEAGDYLLQNFALFVPLHTDRDPMTEVLELADVFYDEIERYPDRVGQVLRYKDIEKNRAAGKLSAMLTVEEGGVCKGSLGVLRDLYRLGVRMLTLTWNFENELGWPNTVAKLEGYDPTRRYGLKEQGIAFVEEMNRLGMIVDVSHLSDDGFYDVCKYSRVPFVASHSNARSLCGHSRNLTDDMIRQLADHGGVTGINFCPVFLREDGCSTAERMVAHMKHIINVGGEHCLGLGTDFDGIGGELELCDGSKMPLLAREMEKQGFTERQIEAVFYQNVLDLYKEVLK